MSIMMTIAARKKQKIEKVASSIVPTTASKENVKNCARLVSPFSSPVTISKNSNSSGPEAEILDMGGSPILNPNIEYAHARSDCGLHPFVLTNNTEKASQSSAMAVKKVFAKSNAIHCPKCFCFVCDQPAENCSQWNFGEFHCNAHRDEPTWELLRDQNKIPIPMKNASSQQLDTTHAKEKVIKLKKILRQNGQHVTGRKAALLERIQDGEKYGRLDLCPECSQGRLKVHEGALDTIICPGYFDGEDVVHCGYCCSADEAPRKGLWIGPANSSRTGKASMSPEKARVIFEKCNVTQLKEMLQRNGQHVTGKKKELLERVVDGCMNGPLSNCPTCCAGRLKVNPYEASLVVCPGSFDLTTRTFESCNFFCSAKEAPREGAWEM